MDPGTYESLSLDQMRLRAGEKLSAEAYFFLGLKAADGNQFGEAVYAFGRCLNLKPDYLDAHYFRAKAMLDLGIAANDEIEAMLETASKSGTYDVHALCLLVKTRIALGRLGAIQELLPRLCSSETLHRVPEAHGILSELSAIASVVMDRPHRFQKPVVDQKVSIAVPSTGRVFEPQLRIFDSYVSNFEKVLVLTVAHQDQYPGTVYEEEFAQELFERFGLQAQSCLVVFHFVKGITGPHITALQFSPVVTKPERNETLSATIFRFFIGEDRNASQDSGVLEKKLLPVTKESLEGMIGFRLIWEATS